MKKLLFLVLLAGCASGPTHQQQEEAHQAYRIGLRNSCTNLGFTEGTDPHRNCMLSLHQQNEANRGAAAAAILGSGMYRQQPYQHQPYVMPQNRSLNTTCQRIGDQTYCTTR